MKIREIKELAKQFVMVNKYNPLILYAAVVSVAAVFSLVVLQIVWFALAFIPLYFLYAPVSYSSTDFYMRSYNLRNEENFRLFEGFKKENFFRVLFLSMVRTGFGLLFTIGFFVGLGVALGYHFHPIAAVGMGLLLSIPFLVPAAIYYARTSIAVYLLRSDAKLSAFSAFKMSISMMKGKSWRSTQLFLSYLGWFCFGIVTVGLVFIYAMPHYQTAKSIFFRREILGIEDDQELPNNYEESIRRYEIKQLNQEIESAKDDPLEKKRKKFDRQVIVDELEFEQEAEDIRKMITTPEVILPPNARQMNPADLEIRENETFEEYRARIQRYRNLNEGKISVPTPGKRRSAEEEAVFLSREKEKLKQETEMRHSPFDASEQLAAQEEAERQERILQGYFKTDEQVAKIVEEQIVQNTADIIQSYPGPDAEAGTQLPSQIVQETNHAEAWYAQALDEAAEFEQRKKAVAEKIASLKKADAKKSTAERTADFVPPRDRRTANDLRAQSLRSRDQVSTERIREHVSGERSRERVSAAPRTAEKQADEHTDISGYREYAVSREKGLSGKPSREEILERIRRERDKK